MKMATPAQKRMLYALARQLGMDDGDLHARVLTVTGKEHISQLGGYECARVIDSLQGISTPPIRERRPVNRATQGQIQIIVGLARKLGWMEEGYGRLNGFLRVRIGVDRLEWLTAQDAIRTIEALKAMMAAGRGERKGYGKEAEMHGAASTQP